MIYKTSKIIRCWPNSHYYILYPLSFSPFVVPKIITKPYLKRVKVVTISEFRSGKKWHGRSDSNARHLVLETSALPTELHPYLRRERDSNPRYLTVQRFSRPPQSTTLPSLLYSDCKSKPFFHSAKISLQKNNDRFIDKKCVKILIFRKLYWI